jgi:hypothetical protein
MQGSFRYSPQEYYPAWGLWGHWGRRSGYAAWSLVKISNIGRVKLQLRTRWPAPREPSIPTIWLQMGVIAIEFCLHAALMKRKLHVQRTGKPGNVS